MQVVHVSTRVNSLQPHIPNNRSSILVISSGQSPPHSDLEFSCEQPRKKRKKEKSSSVELLFSQILDKLDQSDKMEDKIMKTMVDSSKLLRIQTGILQAASFDKISIPIRKKTTAEETMEPFQQLADLELKIMNKITKDAYNRLLNHFEKSDKFTIKHVRIKSAPKDALLMTLQYLCNNMSDIEISMLFQIPYSTTKRFINSGVDLIYALESEVLTWPSIYEAQFTERQFAEISRFPDIMGAVGRTHIPIRSSSDNSRHSVYLIAVCDTNKRFTYVYAGNSECRQIEEVFSSSPLAGKLINDPSSLFPSERYHIIGNSSFKVDANMMVPYPVSRKLSFAQRQFNLCLSKARKVIDDAFQTLRSNFKRLQYIDGEVEQIPKIILACCVIHNLMASLPTEIVFSEEAQNNLEYSEGFFSFPNLGILKREKICKYLNKLED